MSVKSLKFSALVRLHENEVFSLALYLLRDRSEAEDMAQEVYIRLWEHLAQVDFTRAKYWLLRVTRNACLDRLRRRSLERDYAQQLEEAGSGENPLDVVAGEQRSAVLQAAIAELEEPYRSMIILRDIHQHSYQDIASILEFSLDQVRVYLHRARRRLRTVLEEVEI